MSTEAGESARRVLPYDIAVAPGPFIGGVLSRRAQPSPPTWDDLDAAGLIAPEYDPDRWFSPEELATAQWLRGRGLVVASVQRRKGIGSGVGMYGDHLDEVVLILDGDLDLGWSRG